MIDILAAARAVFDYTTAQICTAVGAVVAGITKYDISEQDDNADDAHGTCIGESADEHNEYTDDTNDPTDDVDL